MKEKALTGLKILDLTHFVAGPYCTKLMAGFGAEVIKVERPGKGDGMRSAGPFWQDEEGIERSIPFLWLNTGKKSITLNLKSEKGVEILKQLVREADVLIENFSYGVMHRLGLNYEVIREINPRIIMTSISNFGQSGPYRNYRADEIQINALSGGMYLTGSPDREPLASGPNLYQYTAGQHAYLATLLALFRRTTDGEGEFVDMSLQESGLEQIEISMTYALQEGRPARRGGHMFVPWNTYQCSDGFATIISMPARHWHRASEIFEDKRLFEDKYRYLRDRIDNRQEYEDILRPCVAAGKKEHLFQEGQSRGLAFGYVAGIDEVVKSPQHRERKFFVDVNHPATGSYKYCDAPFKMSESPWRTERAPLLGEHNNDVYGNLGYLSDEIKEMEKEGIV